MIIALVIVSIPYRYKQNFIFRNMSGGETGSFNPLQVQTTVIVKVRRLAEVFQSQSPIGTNNLSKMVPLFFQSWRVSIPYRYKQNIISREKLNSICDVSIPYRYKQNQDENGRLYLEFPVFQSPIGTNKTFLN